jgi:predicted O-methyltransferase YrrM
MIDTVNRMRDRFPEAFAACVHRIREAGTDNLSHFGNEYVKEGGYSLQQNPDEFAALILLAKSCDFGGQERPTYMLEIGSASGGTARMLQEHCLFHQLHSIDDGTHHRYPELAGNLADVPGKHLRADSHGPEARDWLEQQGVKYDLCFIDGDHTYEGVWKDVELTRPHWRYRALVVFHDIVAVGDVKRAWERGGKEGLWVPFAEYVGAERPLGIGVGVAL